MREKIWLIGCFEDVGGRVLNVLASIRKHLDLLCPGDLSTCPTLLLLGGQTALLSRHLDTKEDALHIWFRLTPEHSVP